MIPYISTALEGETIYSQDIIDTTWEHIFTACYPDNDTNEIILNILSNAIKYTQKL